MYVEEHVVFSKWLAVLTQCDAWLGPVRYDAVRCGVT